MLWAIGCSLAFGRVVYTNISEEYLLNQPVWLSDGSLNPEFTMRLAGRFLFHMALGAIKSMHTFALKTGGKNPLLMLEKWKSVTPRGPPTYAGLECFFFVLRAGLYINWIGQGD